MTAATELHQALAEVAAAEREAYWSARVGTATTMIYLPWRIYDRLIMAHSALKSLQERLQWEYL